MNINLEKFSKSYYKLFIILLVPCSVNIPSSSGNTLSLSVMDTTKWLH